MESVYFEGCGASVRIDFEKGEAIMTSKLKTSGPKAKELQDLGRQAQIDPDALAVLQDAYEESAGHHPLIGKPILYMGVNFMFSGMLERITLDQVTLTRAQLIYDTGEIGQREWQSAVDIPGGRIYLERAGGGTMFEVPDSKIAKE
jgi:hypothetical protein